MSMDKPHDDEQDDSSIHGSSFTIRFCDGAEESFNESLSHVTKAKKVSLAAQIYKLLGRKANGLPLAEKTNVKEAGLPDGSNFFAIKKLPLRCYYWISKAHKSVIFVSHFKYKDKQKLSPKDTNRIRANWWKYEKGSDT